MFGKKKHEDIVAFLGKGSEFTGKFIFSGTVRIDGSFNGEIFGDGTLAVGEEARITADINTGSVMISGKVKGQIAAKEKIGISATGRFSGALKTPVLAIEEGALFDGTASMSMSADVEVGE
jgi:cytoskeletal protein CcmA (bactofilin family)